MAAPPVGVSRARQPPLPPRRRTHRPGRRHPRPPYGTQPADGSVERVRLRRLRRNPRHSHVATIPSRSRRSPPPSRRVPGHRVDRVSRDSPGSRADLGRPSATRSDRHLGVGYRSRAPQLGRLARHCGRCQHHLHAVRPSRAHLACRVARARRPPGSPIRRSAVAHRPTDRRRTARRLARVPRGRRRAD